MFDWTIVSARFLTFTSILILFGSSLFYLYGLETGMVISPIRRWTWPHRLLVVAALVGLLGTTYWLMAETISLSGDPRDAINPAALWSVVADTHFGQISFLRIVLLGIATAVLFALSPGRMLWIAQSILAGGILGSFAWSGHGARNEGMAGSMHLGSDVLHLLSGGVWIGALVPLGILVMRSNRSAAQTEMNAAHYGLERFSGIGLIVVSVIVLSGLVNTWFLIGLAHWRDLFTSAYGLSLVVKLCLFGGMLGLAAVNRFWLAPRLSNGVTQDGATFAPVRALQISITLETFLGVLVIAAVSLLGTLEPPAS